MLIHQGWFTALYTQHLLNSQSLEFEICIFPREAIPLHYLFHIRSMMGVYDCHSSWLLVIYLFKYTFKNFIGTNQSNRLPWLYRLVSELVRNPEDWLSYVSYNPSFTQMEGKLPDIKSCFTRVLLAILASTSHHI